MQTELNFTRAIERKEAGMKRAAGNNIEFLEAARKLAVEICRARNVVTSDDVRELAYRDPEFPWPRSTAAWGSIFSSREFRFTGMRIKSKYVKNNGRELKVWALRRP